MTPAQVLFAALALACLSPYVTSAMALVAGMLLALTLGNPFAAGTKKWTSNLLQLCVMGLGGGMNLAVVGKVGLQGIGYTVASISATMLAGTLIGRLFRTDRDTSLLVSSGTAICGGSAIAAVASTIHAKSAEISVALATVFFLNSTALLIFPPIGHALGLDQRQFGLWSALAIHDTSSVVGAALQYGPQALEVATTVKLARALWIIPLAMIIGIARARRKRASDAAAQAGKAKKPWFILGFVMIAAIVTFAPALAPAGQALAAAAKRGLVLTLFLIGAGLSRATLKSVGARPFLQGLLLWFLVGSLTLAAIESGWIR